MNLTGGARITWLGHATFLIETPGRKSVVIDPFLTDNPACPPDRKHIDRCDLMLLSHAHGDHIGDAIPLAKQTRAQVVCIFELAEWLQSKGVQNVTGMGKGGTLRVGELSITLTHAFHSSSIEDGDQMLYGGEPVGIVLRLENGFRIYHAGDTAVFGDMALIGELYHPDIALLPIGDHFTMGPDEAAKAIQLLGVKHVIPMHYGTFPVLTGTPDQLKDATRGVEGLNIHALKPGDTLQ